MSAEPYKVRETHSYTETVFYSADGEEQHRDRNYDDWLVDADNAEPITAEEREDYFPSLASSGETVA